MDGVGALVLVLAADTGLAELVPDGSIHAGPAAIGAALPFVMVESVSKVDLNIPAPGAHRFVRERVQATVVASNYPEQKDVLRAVRRAAADKLYPVVPGISGVTIHTDSAGPDFYDDVYSGWRGSQDFMTKYLEER